MDKEKMTQALYETLKLLTEAAAKQGNLHGVGGNLGARLADAREVLRTVESSGLVQEVCSGR